jgi:heme/copper-type cytochrome/quinol oxidase subunit 2
MQKNAMIGGILAIISGAFGILGAGSCVLAIIMFTYMPIYGAPMPEEFVTIMTIVYSVIGFLFLLVGVLAIVGGAFGIRKKNWPLALAGSIAGTITFFPCGIPAIIFTTMAKPEFDKTDTAVPAN